MSLTRPLVRLAAVMLAVALLAGACAEGGLQVSTGRTPTTEDGGRPRDPNTPTTRGGATGDADDETMQAAFEDVEAFWEETYPDVYGDEYESLAGGLHPYGPTTEIPSCGGPTTYQAVAGNAFYCPLGDFIAWDTTRLIPDLLEEYGPFALAVVMAHEMGHAIQLRAEVPQRSTILLEQMADCFAGAWTDWAQEGGSENFEPSATDLDNALAGMLELRDPLGVDPTQPGAHGTAFDRIGAFQDGHRNGASRCATYDVNNLSVIDLGFQNVEDFQRGGDWPFDARGGNPGIEDFVLGDLLDYWTKAFADQFGTEWDPIDEFVRYDPEDVSDLPECSSLELDTEDYAGAAFYCSSDDFAAWDESELMPTLYEQIGDMGVGSVLGTQYSRAAQFRLGISGTGLDVSQQADCFTGTWLASVYAGDRATEDRELPLGLSPGDLDEAVISFLRFRNRAGEDGARFGTAFERTAALRDGFLNGIDQCMRYVD